VSQVVDELVLDTVAFQWREALDSAADSLDGLARSRLALRFPPAELQARALKLKHEREATERGLELLAATLHAHLQRHTRGADSGRRAPIKGGAPCRAS